MTRFPGTRGPMRPLLCEIPVGRAFRPLTSVHLHRSFGAARGRVDSDSARRLTGDRLHGCLCVGHVSRRAGGCRKKATLS